MPEVGICPGRWNISVCSWLWFRTLIILPGILPNYTNKWHSPNKQQKSWCYQKLAGLSISLWCSLPTFVPIVQDKGVRDPLMQVEPPCHLLNVITISTHFSLNSASVRSTYPVCGHCWDVYLFKCLYVLENEYYKLSQLTVRFPTY